MKKLDRTALSLIVLCLLVLSGVVLFGSRQPMRITCENKNLNEVSPRGNISFTFSRPVDQAKAAALWQIEPSATGRWQWKDVTPCHLVRDHSPSHHTKLSNELQSR
jgi:hypothetical protein